MSAFEIMIILFSGSLLAGLLGALSGLGGGIIVVPLLVLVVGADIHYAIGASLMAVIATSSGASAAYVKQGFSNVRLGVFLETSTTLGALSGVVIGALLPTGVLSLLFGIILLYCAFSTFYSNITDTHLFPPDKIATFLKLDSSYPSTEGEKKYHVQNVPFGYLIMFSAGALSGILGIGSGALKVLAMDKVMKLPFKVSTTTSNFMIGVTAAASAGLYLHFGYIDPILTIPVMLGVVVGSVVGSSLLQKLHTKILQKLFACLIFLIAGQMIYKGLL